MLTTCLKHWLCAAVIYVILETIIDEYEDVLFELLIKQKHAM